MTSTTLIHRLGHCTPRTTRELLDIATNHADSEETVAATLNTHQSKGKQVVDHDEGSSSRFKKKKKNDKHRHDDNLVAAVERKATRSKSNPAKAGPPKDHLEKLLKAPYTHHEVIVKNVLKDCRLMKKYVNDTLKPKVADPQKKVASLPDSDDDDVEAQYPGEDEAIHMIFGRSPTRP
jgi:lambda repressor-like predicted transcriptional regulator